MKDTADRFANRVEMYVNYRPDYPPAIIPLLQDLYGLDNTFEIADIGAGVGHSVRLLLPVGCFIYAIEPSQAMYNELAKLEFREENVAARLETAENTDLDDHSIDIFSSILNKISQFI